MGLPEIPGEFFHHSLLGYAALLYGSDHPASTESRFYPPDCHSYRRSFLFQNPDHPSRLSPCAVIVRPCFCSSNLDVTARSGPRQYTNSYSIDRSLYANDSAVFIQLHQPSFQFLQQVLQVYCDASRGQINIAKSELAFIGSSVPISSCLQRLPFKLIDLSHHIRYLGFYFSREQPFRTRWLQVLQRLHQRVRQKLDPTLNFETRYLLLRHKLADVPLYSLPFLALDQHSSRRLEQSYLYLLWGTGDGHKGRKHLVRASVIFSPQNQGGLALRSPMLLQKAFWGKLLMRFINLDYSSTWVDVLASLLHPRGGRPEAVKRILLYLPLRAPKASLATKLLLRWKLYAQWLHFNIVSGTLPADLPLFHLLSCLSLPTPGQAQPWPHMLEDAGIRTTNQL
ncbi:hypothetical protein R1sor_001560 [Riccia sorocarpa]|uniref:Maturase K n=1 Tax=Riccia sorocarpa TaxID=122646 RepID=A0ABD3GWB6_9MARC